MGDEFESAEDGDIRRTGQSTEHASLGERVAEWLRGRATTDLATEDVIALLRDE